MKGWPRLACKSCIRVLDEMRELKEKIRDSEEKLAEFRNSVDFVLAETDASNRETQPISPAVNSPPTVPEKRVRTTRSSSSKKIKQEPEEVEEIIEISAADEVDSGEDDDKDPHDTILAKVDESCEDINPSSSAKKRRNRRIEDHPYDEMMFNMDILRCHLCPETFPKYGQLTRHCGTVHSCKANVVCCNHSFPKIQLSDHMKYHLDSKSFACTRCDKNFLSGQLLDRHNSTKHQMGESQYKCQVCDHKFRAPNLLRIHMTKHTDKSLREEFKCQHCSKGA